MNKTKIEWIRNPDGTQGFVSNPITGLCPVQCKLPDGRVYCYGKNNYYRFKRDKQNMFWMHKLDKIRKRKKPAGIFMCSTFELFHDCTKGFYRDAIFGAIKACPQHRFYILTKFPQNIDREMPHNVWLGVTVTENGDMINTWRLGRKKAKIRFVSIEPIFERIDPYMIHHSCNWIIAGRLTGYGHQHDPEKGWIEEIVWKARERDVPIFLKDNLKKIWGENLIQEFPK